MSGTGLTKQAALKGFPMARETAQVPTGNGARYLQQLCKHWSHKLDVRFSDNEGIVRFPNAVATMTADAETLTVSVEADEGRGRLPSRSVRIPRGSAPLRLDEGLTLQA